MLLTFSSVNAVDQLTDPTRPANYAWVPPEPEIPRSEMDWKLSAVKIGPTKSAILNGRVVFEGEEFGAATVIEIAPSAVRLEYGGAHVDIMLLQHDIKRPSLSDGQWSVR